MQSKASKLEVLEFIYKKGIVSRLDLANRFGYTLDGASSVLKWLKSQGLAINERKGEWGITDHGLRRLIYYGRQ